MNEILTINYESENPTVSARELHEKLHIGTKFTTWFERMKEYGFSEGKEFFPKLGETSEQGGRPQTDFEISVDMAKQICMIQRSPEGKQIRQYFIDLENAWNTPEQIFARALKMADKTIPDDNHVVDMRDTQVRLGKDSIGKGSINNNVGRKMSHFTPPTVEEVQEYCFERGNAVDAQSFVDFYTSKG